MDGPPVRLMIDPDAVPKAYHTLIPVPLQWQVAVKAGADQDVALGGFKPVPVGEPVVWSHRMVVNCAKKSSKPCRTVDFQASFTPQGKPTTLKVHSTKYAPSRATRKSVYWTPRMDTAVFRSTKTTAIVPRS